MTLAEFIRILDMTGLPVTYSHWTPMENNPVPNPPYICYIVDGTENLVADNKVYHKINDVNVELYTTKKDLITEAKLEKVLDNHRIPYDASEAFIKSEQLYQKIYEVRLI